MNRTFTIPELKENNIETSTILITEDPVIQGYEPKENEPKPCKWSFTDKTEGHELIDDAQFHKLDSGWMLLFADPGTPYLITILQLNDSQIWFELHLRDQEGGNKTQRMLYENRLLMNHNDIGDISSAIEGFMWHWTPPKDSFILW